MRGGITYRSAREVLFVGDCEELEETAGEEAANVWETASLLQGDQFSTGFNELLKVLLNIVEGCKGPGRGIKEYHFSSI
jgi:hypothetical protein